jgi:hypothetical protein
MRLMSPRGWAAPGRRARRQRIRTPEPRDGSEAGCSEPQTAPARCRRPSAALDTLSRRRVGVQASLAWAAIAGRRTA